MIAAALDYRPNRAAQNLAGGPASIIGLVVGEREIVTRPYVSALIEAVAAAADRHDQALVLIMGANDPNHTVRETVGGGVVDGVIVSVIASGDRWIKQVLAAGIPSVMIGNPGTELTEVPIVDVENRNSSAELVGHLLDGGSRRVATITGPPNRLDAAQRLEGYRLAHEKRGLAVDESLIFVGDFSRHCGYRYGEQILASGADAAFCANDETARGLFRRLLENDVRVGDEFALAGFDGTSTDPFDHLQLTSVIQPFAAMADASVELLLARVAGDQTSEQRIFDPELFFGRTTRPALGL
jgi:DNA-binding LacI/PurR family transcriptional regulator